MRSGEEIVPWTIYTRQHIGVVFVFVYYFVYVSRPFEAVERRLLDQLNLLGGLADAAYREGEQLRDKVGVGRDHPVVAKTVQLMVGTPLRGGHQTTIPFAWEATGTPGLFPRLDADLILAGIGPDLCQVALRGTYAPPLGYLGRALDRAVLHRLAESSVKSFVDRVAEVLKPQGAAAA